MLFTECFSARTRLVVIIAVCTLLAACGPGAEAILPKVTLTATVLPTPTETRTPTATPLPPDLPFSGFYTKRDDPNHLYILNNSLHNWETIEFPPGSRVDRIGNALSPDKNWVVFETGSIEEGDIAINLMYLPDRSVITIAKLLSDRYPDDLNEIADQLVYEDPETYDFLDKSSVVAHSFQHNLGKYAWSPDGRYLAFVGQIDGPSSDVYMYDMVKGELARLTADIHLAGNIRWSPDSDTILFSHLWPNIALLEIDHLHYVEILDRNINNPKEINPRMGLGWISDNEYLIAWSGEGIPPSGLKAFNVENGMSSTIWPGRFYNLAISPEEHSVMLFGSKDIVKEIEMQEWAIYLVDSNGEEEEILAADPSFEVSLRDIQNLVNIYYWDGGESDFLISYLDRVYSYSSESGLLELANVEGEGPLHSLHISPDLRWVMLLTYQNRYVYNANGQLIVELPSYSIGKWGPNSAGFFYMSDERIHYISLSDGEITVLDPTLQGDCCMYSGDIIWLED